MPFVSFAPFELRDGGPGGSSYWSAPDGVSSLIDLTPPGRDSIVGYDPSVNLALVVSDAPLADAYHHLGSGNATDIMLGGSDLDAWQAITGRRPTQGLFRLSDVIADHLLLGADPKGNDFAKPLTAGFNRGLEIHLGGQIWSHTITDWNDPLALPVMQVEAESLAQIYREQGETQYRLALGGLHNKYNFYGPVKGLIQWLFPNGRWDLPLMDELEPQTVKTETWPSAVSPTSGQDNTWVVVSATWTMASAGVLRQSGTGPGNIRLNYSFGGNDRDATFVNKSAAHGAGIYSRSDSTGDNGYLGWQYQTGNGQIYKFVSATATLILTGGAAYAANDTQRLRTVGSSHKLYKNGTDISSGGVTNTAVTAGTYSLLRGFESGADFGRVDVDDLIATTTNRRRRVICTGGR